VKRRYISESGHLNLVNILAAVRKNAMWHRAVCWRLVVRRHPVQKHLHHHYTHGKNVAHRVQLRELPSLGRDVARGPTDPCLVASCRSDKAEVYDDDPGMSVVLIPEHQIRFLDITVDETIRVHVGKAQKALLEERTPPLLIHLQTRARDVAGQTREVASAIQLKDHEVRVAVLRCRMRRQRWDVA